MVDPMGNTMTNHWKSMKYHDSLFVVYVWLLPLEIRFSPQIQKSGLKDNNFRGSYEGDMLRNKPGSAEVFRGSSCHRK